MTGPGATLALVDAMFRWIRTFTSHGADHPLAEQRSTDTAEAVRAAGPPFALQFVLGAVFRDGKLVAMDAEQYQRAEVVARALRQAGVQELAFSGELGAADARCLGAALARAGQGPTSELDDLVLSSVRWRSIPIAQRGAATEAVAPETAATVGVALAVGTAESLPAAPDGRWPWNAGVDAVRRIERALASDAFTALRVIESAPGAWSVARRAVSAGLHTVAVLRVLGAGAATQRAAGHAALLLAARGLDARAGRPLDEVAASVSDHLFSRDHGDRFEPHHLRVAAICHALAAGRPIEGRSLVVMPLIALVYALERRRLAPGSRDALTRIELLAHALADPSLDERWTRILANTLGLVPPGASVALPDGRIGVVVGPGRGPFRPEILIDGALIVPEQDVRLVGRRREAP